MQPLSAQHKDDACSPFLGVQHHPAADCFHAHPRPCCLHPFGMAAVFTSHGFTGQPQESDEMRPEWFEASMDAIPFDQMW